MRKNHNQSGYTFIELLVVTAIIAILAAIAVISYINYRNEAKKSACAEQVGRCFSMAAAEWGNNGTAASKTCGQGAAVTIDINGGRTIDTNPSGCTCSISDAGVVSCTVP